MGARGIQALAPCTQLCERFCLQFLLEPSPPQQVHRRGVEQGLDQPFDVKTRATNNYWRLADLAGALDPFIRFGRPARRRKPFRWLSDVDSVMRDPRALRASWLGGADIEVAVDLA